MQKVINTSIFCFLSPRFSYAGKSKMQRYLSYPETLRENIFLNNAQVNSQTEYIYGVHVTMKM